jgi:hypothetical protein
MGFYDFLAISPHLHIHRWKDIKHAPDHSVYGVANFALCIIVLVWAAGNLLLLALQALTLGVRFRVHPDFSTFASRCKSISRSGDWADQMY